mgnify:FL=1
MENKNETKPLVLEINDFKNSMADLVNNTSIPFSIICMVLKDVLVQCDDMSKRELVAVKNEYEKSTDKNRKEGEK